MTGKPATDPSNSWQTPLYIIEAVGPFDLDPCAASNQPDRCAIVGYTAENDGLKLPWFGRVFCNPPYGRHTRPWLERCRQHGDVIALVFPKSIGAKWFQQVIKDTTVLFIQGRVSFIDPATGQSAASNTQWSCLIAWGEQNRQVLRNCNIPGFIAEITNA